jgi:hypothetical protein
VKHVCLGGSHIHDWRSAPQPAIPSSDAEGDRSLLASNLVKILKCLQADDHSR